jgi:tRNA(Ile)-lysidine synthase
MLDIERSEIEEYLKILNCSYRTDKTNFDAQYLRNKIRLKLVPFLNENFSGWASSILNAGERYRLDGEYIEEALQAFPLEKTEGGVQISLEAFLKLPAALKSRVLIKAFNLAGQTKRIPQAFLNDVINSLSLSDTFRFKKIYGQMEIECQKSSLFIKKYDKSETDLEFFVIIENTGIYELPFGSLCVFNKEGTEGGKVSALVSNNDLKSELEVSLPVIVRSIRPDDEIETADRKMKKIADILNDWKVPSTDKMFLPVFQELEGKEQKITGLLRAFLGYKDWIVKV